MDKLFKFKCAGVKFAVHALFGDELFVVSAFNDSSVVKDHDYVGILNG